MGQDPHGMAIVDGVFTPLHAVCVPFSDPAVTHGWTVFETLRVDAGVPRRLDLHLDRLASSAARAWVPCPPREVLISEVHQLAGAVSAPLLRLRITLTAGGMRILTAEVADVARLHAPIRAVRGPHRDDPWLPGEVKHGSRAAWRVAVRASGADEVLLVDRDGRFTEGTTCSVLAVIDGVLWTAPEDGRILASTACAEVIERAVAQGVPVRREGPPAQGPWDGLYIASSLRDLAPVVEIDGVALPGWDPVGRALAGLR